MSKVARKARAAAAPRGTIAADHRIEICEKVDRGCTTTRMTDTVLPQTRRLAEEELAHLPLFIVNTTRGYRAKVWRSGDGKWWRRGGSVRIQRWPVPNGPRAFVVFLHKGANQDDLEFLLEAVDRARAGKDFDTLWAPMSASWADEFTYRLEYAGRNYGDPYTHSDPSQQVTACTEPPCRDTWHNEHPVHYMDGVIKRLPEDRGHYEIRVSRCFDEEAWTVDVHTDEFFGTPEDVTSFVNDLQWMQEECRRANMPNEQEAADDTHPAQRLGAAA